MKKELVIILAMPLFLVACSSSIQHNLQSWAFEVVT